MLIMKRPVAKQYPLLAWHTQSSFKKPLGWTFILSLPFHPQLQGKGPEGPPPKGLMYSVNPEEVKDLNKLGKPIANMCRGIPTYMAEEIEGE